MDISISFKDVTTMIVNASGKINLETASEYGTAIKDAIYYYDEEIKELILDFSNIAMITSIGLKVILELYKEMEEKHGVLKIIGASGDVKKSFTMVGFERFITIE